MRVDRCSIFIERYGINWERAQQSCQKQDTETPSPEPPAVWLPHASAFLSVKWELQQFLPHGLLGGRNELTLFTCLEQCQPPGQCAIFAKWESDLGTTWEGPCNSHSRNSRIGCPGVWALHLQVAKSHLQPQSPLTPHVHPPLHFPSSSHWRIY